MNNITSFDLIIYITVIHNKSSLMVLDIEKERAYKREKKSHLLLGWVRRKEMIEIRNTERLQGTDRLKNTNGIREGMVQVSDMQSHWE